MISQLLIEVDGRFAEALDQAFGDGSFTQWLSRVRAILPAAWSSDEEPPPVCIVLSEDLQDRLTTDQERATLARLEFDQNGVATAGRLAVEVRPVEKPMPDIPATLAMWISSAPSGDGKL